MQVWRGRVWSSGGDDDGGGGVIAFVVVGLPFVRGLVAQPTQPTLR